MSDRCTFWMVYGLNQRAPVVRHKSEMSAIREAERLARGNPQVSFFVLEATHRLRKNDVLIESLSARSYAPNFDEEPYDGVPF